MSSERKLAVDGVFVEFEGVPLVFVDPLNCSAEQIDVMTKMIFYQDAKSKSVDQSSTSKTPPKESFRRRTVVSHRSIELQCGADLVNKSGFVFRLSHLKYHATLLVRNYIREMKGLSLSQTRFVFTFDREGLMQGWTRQHKAYEKLSMN